MLIRPKLDPDWILVTPEMIEAIINGTTIIRNARIKIVPRTDTLLTTKSVKSFKVFAEQYNTEVLWRIEIWDNSGITDNTIHCREIEGLPKVE